MRLAQVVCVFPPYKGGMGKAAYDFGRLMRKENHQVVNFTLEDKKNIKEDSFQAAGEVIRLRPLIGLGKGGFLPQLFFRLKNFDAVILHYPFFGAAEVVWLWKIFNPKTRLIIHYHMDVVPTSLVFKILSLPSKIILKSLFKRADIVTAASLDYVENYNIGKIYQKYKNKFVELPFGVDLENFRPKAAESDDGTLTSILFVGGLDRNHNFKGVDILIKAVALLKTRKINDWQLNIIGRGELKHDLEKLAKDLEIDDQVKIMDKVGDEELQERFRNSDIFVLPSINAGEAFGLVILEAMASGVAIIASDLPGVRGVFTEKEGLKIRPGDVNDLADKLETLISNPDMMKQMGENARRLAEEKYNWEVFEKKLEEIL